MGLLTLPVLGVLTRALLIANPASRRGSRHVEEARAAIESLGASCEVVLTERSGHAGEIGLARGRDFDVVFTLGGDGTAMEVAGALSGSGVPIAVLPGGTGNLLSRALGVPRSVKRAIPALLAGNSRKIDLGVVQGRRFAVAAGVGIDSTMVADTPRWMKQRLGVMAYTIMATRAALRAVILRKFFDVRVEVDGEIIECRAAGVLFANFGAILEDRISFGPDITVDDGMLDCCIFSPTNLRDGLRIMSRVMRRDFRPDRALLYRKGRQFRIETTPPLRMQADGELLDFTPAVLSVEPLAAHVLVPR